jgi:hypothetical protein
VKLRHPTGLRELRLCQVKLSPSLPYAASKHRVVSSPRSHRLAKHTLIFYASQYSFSIYIKYV